MNKTNDTYCVEFRGKRMRERYYRDDAGWLKISARGRVFRMTAEQVLNHLLPALALGASLGLTVEVVHDERRPWQAKRGPQLEVATRRRVARNTRRP